MLTWTFRRGCFVVAAFAAGGCSSILGVNVYDQDAQSVGPVDSSVADQSTESAASTDAAADASADADATVDHQADAGGDGSPFDVFDGASDAWTDAGDAGADALSCAAPCSAGTVRCSSDNGSAQTCEVGADGCTSWVTTKTCGPHQTCTAAGSSASCTCNPSLCVQAGTVCQDAQTVATCSTDADSCPYVASTNGCTAPQSCSGAAPDATCSLTCTDSCALGQTACVSGGLASCALGANGCLAYGTPTACGTRQACTGAAGTAACTCKTDPVCSAVGQACANGATLANCAEDGQGCFYEASSQPCTNGACSAGVCCTNACTNGATLCATGGSVQACSVGSNGCTQWNAASACAAGSVCERGGTPACVDPNWAEWPMPNTPPDVANEAPHVEAYTDNGDGTVTDNVTGLMWQQTITNTVFTWGSAATSGTAQNYCVNLQLAGHTDWRLPSLIELISVLDPSLWSTSTPMMNATFFPGLSSLPIGFYISSTPAVGTPNAGWSIFFETTADSWNSMNTEGLARCVR